MACTARYRLSVGAPDRMESWNGIGRGLEPFKCAIASLPDPGTETLTAGSPEDMDASSRGITGWAHWRGAILRLRDSVKGTASCKLVPVMGHRCRIGLGVRRALSCIGTLGTS